MSKQAKLHQGMETFYCIIYHYFYLSIAAHPGAGIGLVNN